MDGMMPAGQMMISVALIMEAGTMIIITMIGITMITQIMEITEADTQDKELIAWPILSWEEKSLPHLEDMHEEEILDMPEERPVKRP
jgi:hypothetical protein